MSRKYPLDMLPEDDGVAGGRAEPGWATRAAAGAADMLLDMREWRLRHQDISRLFVGITLLMVGALLAAGAAITDNYLHRGVESGTTQPYIVQSTGKGLATNVDMRGLDLPQIEELAQVLSSSGFGHVRQEISWSEVETTRGIYDWSSYEQMVEILSRNGLTIIAVVVDTPDWARGIGEIAAANAPPRDPATLTNFSTNLTQTFGDAIAFVQLWDAPNVTDNWGNQVVTGVEYAEYLEAFLAGARRGNANARVLSPELSMWPDEDNGQSDLEFVEDLYLVEGEATFDILAVRLDGGINSPDDRRVSPSRAGFSRAILFRELMVEFGDLSTPVWATSYGWARGTEIDDNKQAEFVERGMERSWSEWPWMGLMVHWSLLAAEDSPDSNYAIVTPQGTGTPLFERLTSVEVVERSQIANTGFAPMDAQSVQSSGNWENQHLEGRTFLTSRQVGSSIRLEFQGTGLIAFIRSGPEVGELMIEIDGEVVPGGFGEDEELWDLSTFTSTQDFPRTLVDGLKDQRHVLQITLAGPGELTLGGFQVTRDAPFVWPIVLMAVGALISLFFGLRSIAYLFAVRAGLLRRPTDPDDTPPLRQLGSR
ncbi:MAG TPA: hypothetical protein VEW66_02360 [Thermomicrobiales bacterium]|nr:hypothetical protein [Thermomicrobiales bacterium]